MKSVTYLSAIAALATFFAFSNLALADPSLTTDIQGNCDSISHSSSQSTSTAPFLVDDWVQDIASEPIAAHEMVHAQVFHGGASQEASAYQIGNDAGNGGTGGGSTTSWLSRTTVTSPGLSGGQGRCG